MSGEVGKTGADVSAALLDVGDVARLLKCSRRHVWRLADYGAMPGRIKLGALVRFSRVTVEKWIADGCPNMRKASTR